MIVITPPCHKWFHRNSYQKIGIPAQGVWLESVSTLTAWGAFGGYLPSLAQKLTPPFPLLLQDKPCWWNVFDCTGVVDQSSKLLQRLTGNQPSWQSHLSLWTSRKLDYLPSKRNTSLPMPHSVQWKGPSSVSEASAAVVGQEAREGFISEWWMRLLKIVNEVLVILHKSCSFTFLPWLHFIFFMTCYWGLGDLAQNALSYLSLQFLFNLIFNLNCLMFITIYFCLSGLHHLIVHLRVL